jgi:N-acetylmuramoyl-L-alanine amidase
MTDYPLTWLADVLRAGGCRVVEESGWKTRGRPASSGPFKPKALLRHWDASSPSSHGAISTVLNGTGEVGGPLCSILTCRGNSSHAPSVHVIAAGRANHGGEGDGWGVIPIDGANTYAVGHEIAQTVDQPWPADQLDQVRKAEAAILKKLGASPSSALCAHSEYAPGRKIDTTEGRYGQDMGSERRAVQAVMDGGGEDDMTHHYLALTCSDFGVAQPEQEFVAWNSEGSDADGMHAEGAGAIKALENCTMSGVVEAHVIAGQVDLEVTRYKPGPVYSNLLNRGINLKPGYNNVPFVGKWSKGDLLYVRIEGKAEDSEVGSIRIQLDAFSV